MTETKKNKPAAEVKAGSIIGTIWKNETGKGAFYTVTFARLYKQGEQWKRSASFGQGDLEALAKAIALAGDYLKTGTAE